MNTLTGMSVFCYILQKILIYIIKVIFVDYISSKDNPNIKFYQKLSRDKKYRNEYNMFVLEGMRLCFDAVKENAELHCIFITENAAEKYGEALNLLCENAKKTLYITNELGEKLSDTGSTQGIFAICNILDKTELSSKIDNKGKYIILDSLQDPGNIGTIIRTADAVGISGVILCGCCDVYSPKVIRSTMGSIFRIPVFDGNEISSVLDIFEIKAMPAFAAVIDENAEDLISCDFSNGCAVVIGNEGKGLSPETIALCKNKLTIRMKGNVNSLNAAMAAGIIMWEMLR